MGTVDGYAYAGSKVSYGSGASQITGLFTSPNGQTFAGRADLDKAGNIVSLNADRGQNLGDKISLGESLDITRAEAPKYEAEANRDGLTKIAAGIKNAFAKNPELQGMHIDMTRNPETLALTSMSAVGGGYSGYQDLTKTETGSKDVNENVRRNDFEHDSNYRGAYQAALAGDSSLFAPVSRAYYNWKQGRGSKADYEKELYAVSQDLAKGSEVGSTRKGTSLDYTKGSVGGSVDERGTEGFKLFGDGITVNESANASGSVGGMREDNKQKNLRLHNYEDLINNGLKAAYTKGTDQGGAAKSVSLGAQYYSQQLQNEVKDTGAGAYGAHAALNPAEKVLKDAEKGLKGSRGNVLGGGLP